MMHSVMRRRNDDFFEKAHFADINCMVPKLSKKLQRGNYSNNLGLNSKNGSRNKKKSKNIDKRRNTLTQSTGQIKLLRTMVNGVLVPEKIDFMRQTMDPIS